MTQHIGVKMTEWRMAALRYGPRLPIRKVKISSERHLKSVVVNKDPGIFLACYVTVLSQISFLIAENNFFGKLHKSTGRQEN